MVMGPVHSKRTVTKTYTIQLPTLYWLHITLIPFLVHRVKKNIKNNFSASLAVYINITSNGDVEEGTPILEASLNCVVRPSSTQTKAGYVAKCRLLTKHTQGLGHQKHDFSLSFKDRIIKSSLPRRTLSPKL